MVVWIFVTIWTVLTSLFFSKDSKWSWAVLLFIFFILLISLNALNNNKPTHFNTSVHQTDVSREENNMNRRPQNHGEMNSKPALSQPSGSNSSNNDSRGRKSSKGSITRSEKVKPHRQRKQVVTGKKVIATSGKKGNRHPQVLQPPRKGTHGTGEYFHLIIRELSKKYSKVLSGEHAGVQKGYYYWERNAGTGKRKFSRLLTEPVVAEYARWNADRRGFVADGSSRLLVIIRSKSALSYKVHVDRKSSRLAVIESLDGTRNQRENSVTIHSTLVHLTKGKSQYQATAILVAGEHLPYDISSAKAEVSMKLHVDSIDSYGKVSLSHFHDLSVRRAPALLVHGFLSDSTAWGVAGDTTSKAIFSEAPNRPCNRKNDVSGGMYCVLRKGRKVYAVDYQSLYGPSDSLRDYTKCVKMGAYSRKHKSYCENALKTAVIQTKAIQYGISALCKTNEREGFACTKADVVAHSMGGLFARQFIQSSHYQNGGNHSEGSVRRLVMLSTPNGGGVFHGWNFSSISQFVRRFAIDDLAQGSDFIKHINSVAVSDIVPTAALWGKKDAYVSLASARKVAAGDVRTLFTKISGGHIGMGTRPEVVHYTRFLLDKMPLPTDGEKVSKKLPRILKGFNYKCAAHKCAAPLRENKKVASVGK